MVLVVFGGLWQSLAVLGVLKWFWWSLGGFGSPWWSLAVLGGPWRSLAVLGGPWGSLVVLSGPWLYTLSIYYHPFLRLFQSVVGF